MWKSHDKTHENGNTRSAIKFSQELGYCFSMHIHCTSRHSFTGNISQTPCISVRNELPTCLVWPIKWICATHDVWIKINLNMRSWQVHVCHHLRGAGERPLLDDVNGSRVCVYVCACISTRLWTCESHMTSHMKYAESWAALCVLVHSCSPHNGHHFTSTHIHQRVHSLL